MSGEPLPVVMVLGGDPLAFFFGGLEAPYGVFELDLVGGLRGRPVRMVRGKITGLPFPANAEIVLEGYVELDELRTEGPFGDHTGFYSLEDEYPVFHVTCVTHRKDPIYATTIVGPPPMEDFYMGKAIERIFLPLMRVTLISMPTMARSILSM